MFPSVVALVVLAPLQVFVGKSPVVFTKAKPIYRGRLLLIPLREVVEKMGGKVVGGPLGRRTFITVGRRRVELALDGGRSRVDGIARRIAAAPWISKGQVVVPLRFFSSVLGATTVSNPKRGLVQIVPSGRVGAPRPPRSRIAQSHG